MAEISNNLLASLLIVAILISAFGIFTVSNLGPVKLTGRALEYGTANVSITGAVDIEMIRNVTNFGSSTIPGATVTTIDTQTADNYGTFNNGTEGNETDFQGTAVYPFVIWNKGNVNVSINLSAASEASSWIYTSAGAYFKAKNNETGACAATLGSGYGEGAWTPLNVTETVACADLDFETSDTMRVHFRLKLPGDTVGSKGVVITLGAVQS